MRNCLYNIPSISLLVLLLPLSALSAQSPDPESILEAFRHSFVWLDNCSLSASAVFWDEYDPHELWKEEITLHNDSGERRRFVEKSRVVDAETDQVTHDADGPRQYYKDGLYTPETQGFFLRAEGLHDGIDSLRVYEAGAQRYQSLADILATREFTGLFYGRERPLQELLTSETIKNIEEVDLDGQSSYRIEAELEVGSLTLWLAPEMGYAMQKWQLVREYDTHMAGYEVTEMSDPVQGLVRAERDILECTFSEHQNIRGHFIPMKMERRLRTEAGDAQKIIKEATVALIRVELFPDFDASNAFELPDYSRVEDPDFIRKDNTSISGFKWEDGKLVADMDAEDLDDKTKEVLSQLKTDTGPAKTRDRALALRLGASTRDEAPKWQQFPVLVWAAGVLLLLASTAVVAVVCLKRKTRENTTSGDES